MARRRGNRLIRLGLAATLVVLPLGASAIAPALLMLARQAGSSMLKDLLLDSVRGSGCKGAALADAMQGLDARQAIGGGLAGLARLPGAAGLPPGMAGAAMPSAAAMQGLLGGVMPSGGTLPAGVVLAPEQAAMLAQVQQSMARPLSAQETLATIDELGEIGLAPPGMLAELKDCLALTPQAGAGMGMAMGMLRPMLGTLRDARAQLRSLSPQEQDELAARLAEELEAAPGDERRQLVDALDAGFFPPRVVEGLRVRLAR